MFKSLCFFLCLPLFLFSSDYSVEASHLLYLLHKGQFEQSIDKYEQLFLKRKIHNLSILKQMGHILLWHGIRSQDEEEQQISLCSAYLANPSEITLLYQTGLSSPYLLTQSITIHLLTLWNDDQAIPLLIKACSSSHPWIRLRAIRALATKRAKLSTPLALSLMNQLLPQARPFCVPLFAAIGSPESIHILQNLMEDPDPNVRVAAILSAVQFHRDECVPTITAHLTHTHPAEQEACAMAAAAFKNLHAIPQLRELIQSPMPCVSLAAAYALFQLGEHSIQDLLLSQAQQKQLMAIDLLEKVEAGEQVLCTLIQDPDRQVRYNAALTLLKRKHPACSPHLIEMLIKNEKDFGFQPHFSPGRTLQYWKVIPSSTQYAQKMKNELVQQTQQFREMVLTHSIELPESEFLMISRAIFQHQQYDLIPLLTTLLANHRSPGSIALLRKESTRAGAPLIRTYCHIALSKLNNPEPHITEILKWMDTYSMKQPFHFSSFLSGKGTHSLPPCPLTSEENSQLFVATCEALLDHHGKLFLPLILKKMKKGSPKHRYFLAGLLLKIIQ